MKIIKLFVFVAALTVCCSASAQFTNARSSSPQTSYGSAGNDGKGLKPGYRGFIDFGYTFGVGDFGVDRIAFTTTHGYQVLPYFFAGVGAGVNYFHSPDAWGIPIFADLRGTFLDNSISPFIDVKIGYSVLDAEGFFFTPSIGCRFSGFNISVGYELQKVKDDYYDISETVGGIALKLGFDF